LGSILKSDPPVLSNVESGHMYQGAGG